MPIYSAPILNVDLPKPIVLTSSQLTGLYALMLGIDYVLLRHQDKLVISKSTLRLGLTVTHAIVPLAVVSPYLPNNVAFAAVPWFIAAYSAYLPTEEFTLTEWLRALYNTVVDHPLMTSDKDNRTLGLKKVFRGVGKLTFLYFVIEPLLPAKPDDMLKYAWLSKESLLSTFLFGLKAYLILGGMDVLMGFVQCFSGWCMQDMFDSPILSTSPRDFWSRRWNLIVRNLLHSQVFENYSRRRGTDKDGQTSKPSQQKPQKVGFLSTRQGRGLLSFFVSGVFHELIICSVCRKLTLENLCFFCIHGIACMLEVKYYEPRRAQSQWRRVRNIALNIAFMTLTGRLFLAPFLRTRFTEVLPLTYAA